MIGGEECAFNPTRSEQEMPYRSYGSVLGSGRFGGFVDLRMTKKMPAHDRAGIRSL
jgi:hypothetical protein